MAKSNQYAELMCSSNFSFLQGASHAEELVITAKALGLSGIGLTDRNTVAGVVRAHKAAKDHGLSYTPGSRLILTCGTQLLVWPTDRDAWGRLTQLLTLGQRRVEKGYCELSIDDVATSAKGQIFALLPGTLPAAMSFNEISQRIDAPLYITVEHNYRGNDRRRISRIAERADAAKLPLLAVGNVRYHTPARKPLADILTCIRHHVTIDTAGYLLDPNDEHHLRRAEHMIRLFADRPEAIKHTLDIQNACQFSLDELRYNYPSEPVPRGHTPQEQLTHLTWQGAHHRFPDGVPTSVSDMIKHELALVEQMDYAPYFLTVHDIVQYARSNNILCQGRGSAANSVVCYCLSITSVNPIEVDLLFERFISADRNEPPDIDVDFEHERREEVIQYIYARYGRHRASLAATVVTYRGRSAVREVGKAMGLSADTVSALASTVWGFSRNGIPDEHVEQAGLDMNDPRLAQAIALSHELMGFPRHLSQHVGGFVLTETPLSEVVPIQNAAMKDRTVVEWDKDDLDTLGILKIDVLALGMLSCVRKCFDLLRMHYDTDLTLATLPRDDTATYQMLQKADSVGVFQVESRAQMNMLPRLKPANFYDLVIEVAIVRPGPIQGNMVHPYLKRRSGTEAVEFPSPGPDFGPPDELEQVLGKTLGVPLFQEQAMKIAIVAAGFTPGEADQLRRAMATFRKTGMIGDFREKLVSGMTARGYDADFAERCFSQIEGFGEYGFPESHAASFALLVYASAWLKCHYPDVFACALLNSMPMGFYAPAQIVRDAREHSVNILAPDINGSRWDNQLLGTKQAGDTNPAGGLPLLLGFRQIKSFRQPWADAIAAARGDSNFTSVGDLQHRTGLTVRVLQILAEADAFRSIGLDRRQALWQVRGLHDAPDLPLFTSAEDSLEPIVSLPKMALSEHVVDDYQTLRLSLKAHPLSFLRAGLDEKGAVSCAATTAMRDGQSVLIAGLVLVRQRPGSANGVCFATLEDETGVANVVIWQSCFETYRKEVMGSRMMLVKGEIQRTEDIIHIVAEQITDVSHALLRLSNGDPKTGAHLPRVAPSRHPRNARDLVPKSRDFH